MKILLNISYDGTNYFGWQRQKNAISVQQIVEEKLSMLFSRQIKIIGASRTDAKVHALAQKAMFNLDNSTFKIPIEKIPLVINKMLPDDIVITNAKIVDDNFHARYDVFSKTYRYTILNSDFLIPQYRNYCWHIKNTLDLQIICDAVKFFIGTKDFASFCASGSSQKSTIRTIYDFHADFKNKFIIFEISANGFLYNMVRIIIATVIQAAEKKITLSDIEKIIAAKKRSFASKTAPPQGLTLTNIVYKE